MPSEKMRYLDIAEIQVPPGRLQQLQELVSGMPKVRLQKLILQVAEQDWVVQCQLVARLVPMSLEDTVSLLQQVIAYAQHGQEMLESEAQEQIEKVTDALLVRADDLADEGKIVEAATVGFAVMLAVEPQMEKVSDEGHILQHIITETISFLSALRENPADPQVFSLLAITAQTLLDSFPEEDRYYEEDWKQLVKMYSAKGK